MQFPLLYVFLFEKWMVVLNDKSDCSSTASFFIITFHDFFTGNRNCILEDKNKLCGLRSLHFHATKNWGLFQVSENDYCVHCTCIVHLCNRLWNLPRDRLPVSIAKFRKFENSPKDQLHIIRDFPRGTIDTGTSGIEDPPVSLSLMLRWWTRKPQHGHNHINFATGKNHSMVTPHLQINNICPFLLFSSYSQKVTSLKWKLMLSFSPTSCPNEIDP